MKNTNSTIKGATKFGATFVKRVLADNVPVINSFVGTVDEINDQKEKEELQSKLTQINETTSTTLAYMSNISNSLAVLSQKPSLNKIYDLANMLNSTIAANHKYDIEILTDKNKKELRITPKKGPIEFNIRLKVDTQRLEGMSCLGDLIESKIKEGKSVIFTEEEIEGFTFLDDEIRQFWGSHTFHELEFKPQISDLPFDFSFVVVNADIAYHDVKMGSIYTNGNEMILVSTSLPFEILIRLRMDIQEMTLSYHVDLENISVLYLDKLWTFLSAIKNGNTFLIKDSKRGTVMVEAPKVANFDINNSIVDFTRKLAIIDSTFYTNFTYPINVTNEDIRKINEIASIIENRQININSATSRFNAEELSKLIERYEEKGYFENWCAYIPMSYELFGKNIDLGEGRVIFKKAFIRENITQLKREISQKKNIETTFVPGDEGAQIIF